MEFLGVYLLKYYLQLLHAGSRIFGHLPVKLKKHQKISFFSTIKYISDVVEHYHYRVCIAHISWTFLSRVTSNKIILKQLTTRLYKDDEVLLLNRQVQFSLDEICTCLYKEDMMMFKTALQVIIESLILALKANI